MINVKKKILVLVAMLFVFIPFANAEEINANSTLSESEISYEKATIPTEDPTTEGVLYNGEVVCTDEYNGYCFEYAVKITYTITKDYDIEKNNGYIHLDISGDFWENNHFTVQPGDGTKFYITIKNETEYDFSYVDNSLVVSSEDLSGAYNEEAPSFEGFDGNKINTNGFFSINRAENVPLFELMGYKRYMLEAPYYTDDLVEKALLSIVDEEGNKVYPNGIKDLDKYYLNYFSKLDGKTYNSLYELPEKDVQIMFGAAYNGHSQGNTLRFADRTSLRESNEAVAQLGYDYFYNNMFTVIAEDTKETLDQDSKYSVGSYMRDEAPSDLNDQLKEVFTNVTEATTIIKVKENFFMTNVYQSYGFGLLLEIDLSVNRYKVVTKYVDDYGKTLAEDVVEEYLDGKEYKTEEKTFEGYELIKVEGEKTGTINASDVEVTYVYQYVLGEGGEEEPTNLVQTGEEVDYSLMTSALITISLMAIALKTKKKNN